MVECLPGKYKVLNLILCATKKKKKKSPGLKKNVGAVKILKSVYYVYILYANNYFDRNASMRNWSEQLYPLSLPCVSIVIVSISRNVKMEIMFKNLLRGRIIICISLGVELIATFCYANSFPQGNKIVICESINE